MPLLKDHHVDITIDTLRLQGHRVAFTVEKTLTEEPNVCEVAIWNLNEEHRAQLEELERKKEAKRGIPARIEAGYKEGFSQIWFGDLRSAKSEYDKPDWVTKISSGDGEKAFKNSRINIAMGKNTPMRTALRAILKELGLGTGNIWRIESQLKKVGATSVFAHGKVLSGPCAKHLTDICRSADLEWSVQDGTVQFLDRGQVLDAKAVLLRGEPNTGILEGASVDNDGILTVTTLMIPDIRLGGLLVVDSKRIKGNYRVEKATWRGDTHGTSDWTIEIQAARY